MNVERESTIQNSTFLNPKSQIDMSGLVTAISTGAAAFGATNIDDIVILTIFFHKLMKHFAVGILSWVSI